MKLLKSAIALSFLSVCSLQNSALALSVTVSQAGSLSAQDIDVATTELSINGEINAVDLFYIGNSLTKLSELDLSNASIVAYSDTRLNSGASSYAANYIPPMSLAALPLTSVKLPTAGNITIGECAFAGTALTSLTLDRNVTAVGAGAFQNCASLTTVTLSGQTLSTGVFADCASLTTVDLAGAVEVPAATFARCSALTSVNGADNVSTIGERAFLACSALKSYPFSKELTEIGDRAFERSGLTEVELSRSTALASVGNQAFLGAPNLEKVTLPDGLSAIGTGAFFECPSLTVMNVPSAMTEVSDHLFKGDAVLATNNLIGSQVTSIGEYALKDASSVTKLTFPKGLEYIGDGAMEGMTGLTEINAVALNSVPELGNDVWAGVEQQKVKLAVEKDMFTDFYSAEQWKEFTIDAQTDSNDLVLDQDIASVKVNGRFEGTELVVVANGALLSEVRLYNVAGSQLSTVRADSESVRIDTSAYSDSVYIVNVVLNNHMTATVKIARR